MPDMTNRKPAAYDHGKIEKKWQKQWLLDKTYQTHKEGKQKKFYVLDMFPYPSGAGLHVGHPRGYIGSDVYARYKRMQGFNVLHPMGYDAFGLPAEQYAIKHGIHPRKAVEKNVATFEKQLSQIGLSYDWSRKVNTTDPGYYKWTQWIFLKLYGAWYDTKKETARPISELVAQFEKSGTKGVQATCDTGTEHFSAKEWNAFSSHEKETILMKYRLAFEGYSEVNWSPSLGTVLANDEVVVRADGSMVGERDDQPVYKKRMRQWFMRITAYADRLIADLDGLVWPDHIKEIQKNWIGKSEGSELEFQIAGSGETITVFTTRADTLFGVTYVVLAPEHALVDVLKMRASNIAEVDAYIAKATQKDETDRTSTDKEKTGVELKGVTAINPANGEAVPVWIADYVLASYGTGAVMAVPAHDERDFAFANKYDLPIKNVIHPNVVSNIQVGGIVDKNQTKILNDKLNAILSGEELFVGYGKLLNSNEFNNLSSEEAKTKITKAVGGRIVTKYKMRDAVFARQRYWGEPIPLRHHKDGGIAVLKDKELPLELPNVKSYEPTGTGESPLAAVKAWNVEGYETNTMPGWAGSSWYFLRYMDPENTKAFAGEKALAYWKDVDVYVGGAEHATGHLLYSRFWHKFLFDMKLVPTKEPFKLLKNQGMILASDGRKMSKRWGNVINPDEVVATYGADTLRVYEMFMGPFEATLPWSTESIIGARRFVERVWRFADKVVASGKTSESALRQLHKTIKKVTDDIQSFSFNTAISALMICLNEFEKADAVHEKEYKQFVQLLAPFASHVAEELWDRFGEKGSIHLSSWPKHAEKYLVQDSVTLGVQINGRVRAELTVAADASKENIESQALALPRVAEYLAGQTPKKIIVVPGRVINIVV